MEDQLGAFVPGAIIQRAPRGAGPLSGLSFAAKDLFDVAGLVTGCGNPDWANTHEPAEADAWAVDALLGAGATLRGKTVTDEISLGLLGINRFYGTPLNPRAPDCVPGGSSSGSASAVAGGLVDVALGTDSGGSVRIPASFCGLYGLRPTHGRISTAGMMTQAPSFDTVGYFAARRSDLRPRRRRAARGTGRRRAPRRDHRGIRLFRARRRARAACSAAGARSAAPRRASQRVPLAEGDLADWARHQRVLQKSEFHATFRDWIDRVNPRFSAEVAGAFADDGRMTASDIAEAKAFRERASQRIDQVLDGRRMLCLPTSPILPIARDARLSGMRAAVQRIVDLTCNRRTDGLSAGQPADGRDRRGTGGPVPHRLARRRCRARRCGMRHRTRSLHRIGAGPTMTDVKDTRTLTLEGALKVLNAAIAEATRIGQPMCIAVVDTGGNLLTFGRMDGSKGLSVTSSINKARTSALSGAPTGGAHADVEIQVTLAHENRWTNLIGGLPIRVDGFILGAVAAGSGSGCAGPRRRPGRRRRDPGRRHVPRFHCHGRRRQRHDQGIGTAGRALKT